MTANLTIGKLAKQSATTIDSIRFYERRGLLSEPLRTESNYRLYPLEAVDQLSFIKKAQSLGFSLNEVKELLTLRLDPTASRSEVKTRTTEKIQIIRKKITDLTHMLDALQQMDAACDGQGPIEGCPILEALASSSNPECPH